MRPFAGVCYSLERLHSGRYQREKVEANTNKIKKIHMKENTYNGWTNRETWLIPLWWENCPIESLEAETAEDRVNVLETALEDYWEEYKDITGWPTTGLAADMMGDHRINWREIAEHWVDEVEWTLTEETKEEA